MNTCCDCERSMPADRLSAIGRPSLGRALARIGREALTLHRYRELRARALRDALAHEGPCGEPAKPGDPTA